MKVPLQISFALLSACAVAAVAAPSTGHVRGTVQSVNGHSASIDRARGGTAKVMIDASTRYFRVVPSSLSKVTQGSYIGVATNLVNNQPVVAEVILFPPSLRGLGEGHEVSDRPFNPHGSISGMNHGSVGGNASSMANDAASGGTATHSSMTSGTVSNVAGSGSAKQQSAMTSGTVANVSGSGSAKQSAMTSGNVQSVDNGAGGRQVTVSYNGKKKDFMMPPSTPVVTLKAADKSILDKGSRVFIVTKNNNGHRVADVVTVMNQAD